MSGSPWHLPRLGLSYEERLSGAHYKEHEPERQSPCSVRLTAHSSSVVSLCRSRSIDVSGELSAEGIAERAPTSGTIRLATGRGSAPTILYTLSFDDDEGESLALSAQKRLDRRDLYASLTVLTGVITDERGLPRARCLLRFDTRTDLRRYVQSFRAHLD